MPSSTEGQRPGARGLASSGLLLFGILLFVGLGTTSPDRAPQLALVAAAALALRAALAARGVRAALGDFAQGLDLALGLALVLCALALTGGVTSDLYVLLLLDIALARGFLGAAAARFLTAATLLGLALLAAGGATRAAPLDLALRGLWPLALLAALELPAGLAAERPQAAPERNHEARPIRSGRDGVSEVLHDLRSPLTAVRLYAGLVAERTRAGDPPAPEHVENLEAEIRLMEALLEAADAGGKGAPRGGPEAFDLVKLLGGLASTYRLAHPDRLRVEFIAEAPELPVAADAVAVQRALRNVLDNAVKYTPAGGQLRIRAGASGGRTFVVVSDTGIGMSGPEQERAFEFSFRGDGARGLGAPGSGLGLALSQELLEANGGRISLASRPGGGSEVTILLPQPREARA